MNLVIATTATCGPCRMAKAWLQQRGVPFTEINLTQRPDLIQWVQQRAGGQRTVPQFFLDGQWLAGGFRDVQAHFGR